MDKRRCKETKNNDISKSVNTTDHDDRRSSNVNVRRPILIAQQHKMFANMRAVLIGSGPRSIKANSKQDSTKHEINSKIEDDPTTSIPKHLDECAVDEVITKLDSLTFDRHTPQKLVKEMFAKRKLTFSDDDWKRIATHVIDVGLSGSTRTAVDVSVTAINNKCFEVAMANAISQMMAEFVLDPGIYLERENTLPELVGHLIVADWPRAYSRSYMESNSILYHIFSSIKGWLIIIVSESDEDEEVESRCACALSAIIQIAQRRMWMLWPELVDECHEAMREALTDNVTLSKEARRALFSALMQLEKWTSRRSISTANFATQTFR